MSDWRKTLSEAIPSKELVLLFGAFFLCAAVPAHADRSASVTVAFSVYLPPAEQPEPLVQASDAFALLHCDELLASAENPDVQRCQNQQTVYSWQEDHEQTILTIAPI